MACSVWQSCCDHSVTCTVPPQHTGTPAAVLVHLPPRWVRRSSRVFASDLFVRITFQDSSVRTNRPNQAARNQQHARLLATAQFYDASASFNAMSMLRSSGYFAGYLDTPKWATPRSTCNCMIFACACLLAMPPSPEAACVAHGRFMFRSTFVSFPVLTNLPLSITASKMTPSQCFDRG